MSQTVITWSFYLLFFATPLIFTSLNSELFEFNKMMLVYLLTTIIAGSWLIRMIQEKTLILKRTPLDLPLLLFLISQILSTIRSIDPHTSLWGYYSRSNGGLFSILCYILLYYALVSNFNFERALKFLKIALWGGLVVSLYAIPEHFGFSPSCLILPPHTLTADCWVQDVQARVFASLGQPNWLAAYLEMLIFPAIYFALTTKETVQKYFYGILTILYYAAFTFSYSRGASIGLLVGLGAFLVLTYGQNLLNLWRGGKKRAEKLAGINIIVTTVISFIIINILFGSALTGDLRLLQKGEPPARPGFTAQSSVGTQLENGGTESGQIRLIVWKGALEIFKHYPLFGSGVETFAYSYYSFRPASHNLVSEWDFLYNKAHNEYLNYLATTGLVGFLSYLAVILTFIWWSLKHLLFSKKSQKSPISSLLVASILASYLAYLVQNVVQFSVVVIALFFYIFPAFSFLATDDLRVWSISKRTLIYSLVRNTLYSRHFYATLACWIVGIITVLTLYTLVKHWRADTFYKKGQDYSETNPGRAFNYLSDAVLLNSDEPLYHIELGSAAASSAVQLSDKDATLSAFLKNKAVAETQTALNISPANTSIWRTAVLTYYTLSLLDPEFEQTTVTAFDKTILLAPTDAKLYYNKAVILDQLKRTNEAIEALKIATKLKPNYQDAFYKLGELYEKEGNIELAKQQFQAILGFIPNEPAAVNKLQELATASGKKK